MSKDQNSTRLKNSFLSFIKFETYFASNLFLYEILSILKIRYLSQFKKKNQKHVSSTLVPLSLFYPEQ